MSRRTPIIFAPLSLLLPLALSVAACEKGAETTEPEVGANLLGPSGGAASSDSDELGGGGQWASSDEDSGFGEDADGGMEGEVADASDLPKLPPRAKPVNKCRGRGKKRTCKMVDPKPKVSAAYGVRALMGDFRWGMSPQQVLKILAKDIEAEYAARQKKARGAMEQDTNRRWRQEQLQDLKNHHVAFTSASKHRWGVSLIQYEYENDNDEEMIWIKANGTLKKYYFFKDGELWKIFYGYSTDTWPGKSYADVVEEKFKKWFGVSPAEKVKQDKETAAVLLRYLEWTGMQNEKIRAFDMTQVNGVIALVVVDGGMERRLGERLPNRPTKEEFEGDVGDVLGGTDVCYDKGGNIVECDAEAGGFVGD